MHEGRQIRFEGSVDVGSEHGCVEALQVREEALWAVVELVVAKYLQYTVSPYTIFFYKTVLNTYNI